MYDIFKIQFPQTRASSIIPFCAVVMPFFLTVTTSAVLWSYLICTTSVSSPQDMIVHFDAGKNRSIPTPPDAADAPSLSQDIYFVSSFHFMCVSVFFLYWRPFFSPCGSTLSSIMSSCCFVGIFCVCMWKRKAGRSGVTSDAKHLGARLEKINVLFFFMAIIRLVSAHVT